MLTAGAFLRCDSRVCHSLLRLCFAVGLLAPAPTVRGVASPPDSVLVSSLACVRRVCSLGPAAGREPDEHRVRSGALPQTVMSGAEGLVLVRNPHDF